LAEYYDAYDKQKAHEYYLRTRKLKGRKKGTAKPSLHSIRPGSHAKAGIGRKASQMSKSPAQLRSEAQARVGAIKARIAKLEAALKALLKESGSSKTKSKTADTKTTGSQSKSDSKPLTAAQKAQKKKDNAEYYDKHKKPAEKKDTGTHEMTNEQKIEEVRRQLKEARAQLRAAMSRTGVRTSTKPANGMKGR
jgi:uncharacterized protein YPO0396